MSATFTLFNVTGLPQKLSAVQHWRNYVSKRVFLLSEKGQDTAADDTEAAFLVGSILLGLPPPFLLHMHDSLW